MGRPLLLGVLVTYRRPTDLDATLARLARQTRRLDRLLVVDNGSESTVARTVAASSAAEVVTYLDPLDNLGPAGAIALGMRHHLEDASDDDWVVLFDDDDPPPTDGTLDQLAIFGDRHRALDDRCAAVGLAGARLDLRRGVIHRLTDDELHGVVDVDHIGGGQVPLYRVGALRDAGVARADLFFGFDDLELGLRLTRAGYRLVIDGDEWLARRTAVGRRNLRARPSVATSEPTWRRYYSIRNLIIVLRDSGATSGALRVIATAAIGKPVLNLPRRPHVAWRTLRIGARAASDGWRRRTGRTVEPD